jgi:hypothetical protein
MPPPASTRAGPKRSASAPPSGWPMPQARFWIAMASAKTSRLQPWLADTGPVNRPKLLRRPKVSSEIRQPHTRIRRSGCATVAAPVATC